MDGLVFNSIVSDKTHYGVIWEGQYKGLDCIIKMVALDTGIHYDKRHDCYRNHDSRISTSTAIKHFETNHKTQINNITIPFHHTKYIKRKAMSIDNFHHEISMLKSVNKIKLAPKLYHHWIDNKSYKVHYGFIVMERMSSTVKDILLRRNLSSKELEYIQSKINKLRRHNIKHGDLKPSNIGVNLDRSGYISSIRMIDWAKGGYTDDKDKFDRDLRIFKLHVKKNISERE